MALLSQQELQNLFDQLTTEYEYLSNNRLKLESDCKKLQEYIEDQVNQIKKINTDFEKLRQDYVHRGSDSSKAMNDIPTSYGGISNSSLNDQNSAYMQQNPSYQQQQQLIKQQNNPNGIPITSDQIPTQNQGMQIIGSQQPQSQYINDQYAQQQQQMPNQQYQEEDQDQGWELATLVSADQIRTPMIISLFAEILDTSVICSTEFSPDGTCLAIGSDKMLRVYNIENDNFLLEKAICNPSDENDDSTHNYVRSIIWTSDGNTIICGSEDSKIRSFDLSNSDENSNDPSSNGKMSHCFEAGNGDVFQLQISKDDSFFAAVTSDGCLTIYSLNSSVENENDKDYLQYKTLAVLERSNDDSSASIAATSLSISFDNQLIAVGYSDAKVVIWDVETGAPIAEQKCHSKDIYALKFLPDGRLVTASLDSTIKIWNINIGERVITEEATLDDPSQNQQQEENENDNNDDEKENADNEDNNDQQPPEDQENHENDQQQQEQEPEKEEGNENETEKKNEVENQQQTTENNENEAVDNKNETNQQTEMNEIVAEPNDQNEPQKVTTVVKEAELILWREIAGHTDFVLSLAIDPTGTWLLSGSKDLTIRLTNLEEGVMVYSIKAHKNSIIAVCFNPSGRMFCTGSGDKYVKIWSISPEEDVDA